jgi:hypothetical protein
MSNDTSPPIGFIDTSGISLEQIATIKSSALSAALEIMIRQEADAEPSAGFDSAFAPNR